jgi:poly-gamma-glutamate synthesis protein (capsule biosynthesis protein)
VADYQRESAQAAIAAGADAVLGHHPHLLKGVEFIAGKPVFYSLGNFAIEQPGAKYQTPPETRHTVIAWLDYSTGNGPEVTLQPCRIDDNSVPQLLAPGEPEYAEWLAYVTAITAEAGLNARYAVASDGKVTCLPAPPAG